MIFDTDVFIWVQRGNEKALALMEKDEDRSLSVYTYMELLQGARDRRQQDYTRGFLKEFAFRVLPFTANIGHRAAIYIEEFSLSHGLRAGDAVVAATAAESNVILCSGNAKHFKPLRDLKFQVFKP